MWKWKAPGSALVARRPALGGLILIPAGILLALCIQEGERTRVPLTFHGHSIKPEKVFQLPTHSPWETFSKFFHTSAGFLAFFCFFFLLHVFPLVAARFLTLCVSKLPNFVPSDCLPAASFPRFSTPLAPFAGGFPLARLSTHYLREKECSWKLLWQNEKLKQRLNRERDRATGRMGTKWKRKKNLWGKAGTARAEATGSRLLSGETGDWDEKQ